MLRFKSLVFLQVFALITARSTIVNSNQRFNQSKDDRLYFPGNNTNRNMKFASNDRVPLIDEIRCQKNEYLYPGDNRIDWTCDCKPGFVYYPVDGLCHELYRRGPCKEGEILSIFNNFKSPKCVVNECKYDGLVKFNRACQQLDSAFPCTPYESLVGRATYLTVNPATFGLICADPDHIFQCSLYCCTNNQDIRFCFQKSYRQRI